MFRLVYTFLNDVNFIISYLRNTKYQAHQNRVCVAWPSSRETKKDTHTKEKDITFSITNILFLEKKERKNICYGKIVLPTK